MLRHIVFALSLLLALAATQETVAQNYIEHPDNNTELTTHTLSEGQKVERLLHYIRSQRGSTFIRNGSEHSPDEAASHLESKYKKHSKRIKTAEDFIEHLATKSSLSGKVYKIRYPDGRIIPTAEALIKELKRLEASSEN